MSNPRYCPTCGAELGPDAPESLCPRCLIENAAWSQTVALPDALEVTVVDPSGPPPAQAQALPPVGADFGGYRVLRLLGKGGMGAVYEAEEAESGRRVALKVLSHKLDSDEARKRFLREGRLAASINHPNSVYVFGTEEIEGTPAIVMEIVPGGTLQERVTRAGPMAIPEAVDAILQIVEGLESAQAIGILHRDVKPSNCFVDDRGEAKIGDFGLSISTSGHGDSHLTVQGSLLGTPAFSSPEQLRGDELNARSDMYSVGATLFYLLTGRAPFEDGNMVRLLSRVLEEAPPDPRSLRPEIPKGLARLILRCLTKSAADRFKSYAELRKALQPYSSESPTPATLGLRLGAYMIDVMLLSAAGFLVQTAAWGSPVVVFSQDHLGTLKHALIMMALSALSAAYFGYFEGLHGASLGKKLLRLRVARLNGSLAGFWRAGFRVVVLSAITSGPFWVMNLALSDEWVERSAESLWPLLLLGLNLALVALVFCRARRANGYAGLHELATGTRVARVMVANRRPALPTDESPGETTPRPAERIGPYDVIEPLGPSSQGDWFLAYDTRLLRRVWAHSVARGTPPAPAAQRNMNRRGRLRWITGRRSQSENWDAYEAPSGKGLLALLDRPQQWAALRFWLHDLAEELEVAQSDGTCPEVLALDRVWITEDGHAKLLDFPAPGAPAGSEPLADPARFLQACAEAALGPAFEPVPLHAKLLTRAEPGIQFGELRDALRLAVCRPDRISRRRRLAITLAVSAVPILSLVFWLLFLLLMQNVERRDPELYQLSVLSSIIQHHPEGERREQLRQYVAHHYRDRAEDPRLWQRWETALLVDPATRRVAQDAVRDYPELTDHEIAVADLAAASVLEEAAGAFRHLSAKPVVLLGLAGWIAYAAIPALLMALIARRGLVLKMFGAVVVDDCGERASRLRVLWRALLAWSPVLFGAAAFAWLTPPFDEVVTVAVVLTPVLTVLVISHLRRERSLQDLLAGTWLVPK